MLTIKERLRRRIILSPWEFEGTPCWVWTGAKVQDALYKWSNPQPYGVMGVDGRLMRTHRLAWEEYRGPIPEGLVIDHLCRVTLCYNPKHLEPVTQKENVARGNSVWRNQQRGRERIHCKHGHDLTDESNVRHTSRGRECLACARRRLQEFRARMS